MRVAAIDQGTASTRVMLADGNGTACIRHAVKHAQTFPQAGWVEHDPLELLRNIRACIEAAGPVDAIGIDNQGESCLAWDRHTGEPLSAVIVWQDSRTNEDIARLKASGLEQVTLERAGLPLDPYFSAAKLAWLIKESPPVRKAVAEGRARLGTTDAFFLQHLTGRCLTDVTTASRTSLMNLATTEWDAELCALFGVPREALPDIKPSIGDFGSVNNVPVACSIVDQQAALYGHGCRNTGDAKITFGTGAFALALTGDRIVRAAECGLLPTIAWGMGAGDIVRAVDGGVYDAGAAVEWAGRLGLFSDLDELTRFEAEPAIARGLTFVPALSGLACPHWDRSAAALWIGMSGETSRRDLCQALLEGIALRTAEVVEALGTHVPLSDELSVDGGLANNAYFAQFLADVLGRTVMTRQFNELTAVGTAELAALHLGQPLRMSLGDGIPYRPRDRNAPAWRARFADAVQKAKGWR